MHRNVTDTISETSLIINHQVAIFFPQVRSKTNFKENKIQLDFEMAESKKCFNCGDTSHYSICCPQNQLYSRCSTCSNVCFNTEGHKRQCPNVSFRSTFLVSTNTIVEIEPFLELKFESVGDVILQIGNQQKKIGDSPLWIADHSMQIKRIGDIVLFEGAKGKSYSIAVEDKEGRRRLKLFTSNVLVVNGRYSISHNGTVQYNPMDEDRSFGYVNCTIQVENQKNLFITRAKWKGKKCVIAVYPDGAVLSDPIEEHLKNRLKILEDGKREGENHVVQTSHVGQLKLRRATTIFFSSIFFIFFFKLKFNLFIINYLFLHTIQLS